MNRLRRTGILAEHLTKEITNLVISGHLSLNSGGRPTSGQNRALVTQVMFRVREACNQYVHSENVDLIQSALRNAVLLSLFDCGVSRDLTVEGCLLQAILDATDEINDLEDAAR